MSITNRNQSKENTRSQVRQRYGEIAASEGPITPSSCCSGSIGQDALGCCNPELEVGLLQITDVYDQATIENLPDWMSGISLGCGDPISLADLKPGQTVLDLGAGGGLDCFLAARKVGPAGFVIGVDMTPEMLDLARANQVKLGISNIEFRLGEIEHLPVADQSIDVIISNCVINLSPEKPQVLQDAFRVLKPGGRLAISDIVSRAPLPREIREDPDAWGACIAGAMVDTEFAQLLTKVGFIDVNIFGPTGERVSTSQQPFEAGGNTDTASAQIPDFVYSAQIQAFKPER